MDDESYELGGGSYAAMEGDLGEKLRPLAGFGRELAPIEVDGIELWSGVTFTPETNTFQTAPGAVVYDVKFD